MPNTTLKYHDSTSYQRHIMAGHPLQWENQPDIYKTYAGIDTIQLLREVRLPKMPISSLLLPSPPDSKEKMPHPDSMDLSRIFTLTYSITAGVRHGAGKYYYRSVASAGALYPTEIYVATRGITNLNDGIFHFSIARHCLSLLRKGDISGPIIKAIQPILDHSPVLCFFLTAIFFRSAWKYQARSYRYDLLDTGHLLENLVLGLKASGLMFRTSYDFNDQEINSLLGLDHTKEAGLSICYVPEKDRLAHRDIQVSELPDTIKSASQVARNEVSYPEIRTIHSTSSTSVPSSAAGHRISLDLGLSPRTWTNIDPPEIWPESIDYAESVLSRRSSRNYIPQSISHECFHALIACLCNAPESESGYNSSTAVGLLVGKAEDTEPGLYLLDTTLSQIGLVESGLFMDRMARVCLNQEWIASAAIHFLFITNLEALEINWGARGYRYALMTAGRMGQRLYLAATAMGLGCCGIGAFYDMEAVQLLSLNSNSRLIYLVCTGPIKKHVPSST